MNSYLWESRRAYQELFSDDPMCEGVLIMDEVKITGKLIFCPKSRRIVGLGTQFDQYADLLDPYAYLDCQSQNRPAEHILQFIWRDVRRNFDVLGGRFSFPNAIEAKQLLPCLKETLVLFHRFKFGVMAVISDFGKPNVKVMEHLIAGKSGHMGVSSSCLKWQQFFGIMQCVEDVIFDSRHSEILQVQMLSVPVLFSFVAS